MKPATANQSHTHTKANKLENYPSKANKFICNIFIRAFVIRFYLSINQMWNAWVEWCGLSVIIFCNLHWNTLVHAIQTIQQYGSQHTCKHKWMHVWAISMSGSRVVVCQRCTMYIYDVGMTWGVSQLYGTQSHTHTHSQSQTPDIIC